MPVAIRCGECMTSWRERLPIESACVHLRRELEQEMVLSALRKAQEPRQEREQGKVPESSSATLWMLLGLLLGWLATRSRRH